MIVKNTYKHITEDEKMQLYIRLVEQIYYKEDKQNEKQNRSNLCQTECRQKG